MSDMDLAILHGELGALLKRLDDLEGARRDAEQAINEASDPEVVDGLRDVLQDWEDLLDEVKAEIREKEIEIRDCT